MSMHNASPSPEDPQEDLGRVTPMEEFIARARRERERQEASLDSDRPESWCDPDPEAMTRLSDRKHPVKSVINRKGGRAKSKRTFRLKLRQCCERLQGAEAGSLAIDDVLTYPWHHVDADMAADYARLVYATYRNISTRNDSISPLRQMITACCRAGLISVARRDEILEELPTVAPGPSSRRRRLASAEITALLVACHGHTDEDARDGAVIALLATTGIRICELVDVRVSDWDVEAGTIYIRDPKNGCPFTVFVHPVTKDYLVRWSAVRDTSDPEGALFSWPGGSRKGAPVHTDTARSWIRKRQEQAGIPPFGTHDFRRTLASTLLRTHDIALVGKLLNHKKPASTMTYDLASEDEQRDAINSISLDMPKVLDDRAPDVDDEKSA